MEARVSTGIELERIIWPLLLHNYSDIYRPQFTTNSQFIVKRETQELSQSRKSTKLSRRHVSAELNELRVAEFLNHSSFYNL